MYVTDIIGDEYKRWKRGNIIHLTAPTGSGKTTFIFQKLLPHVISRGGKILYMVNRKVLKEQLRRELDDIKNQYLLDVQYSTTSIGRYITIKTYQELEKAIVFENPISVVADYNKYSLVVYDECHYFYTDSSFNTYTELSFDLLRNLFVDKLQIFMSATIKNVDPFIRNRVCCQVNENTAYNLRMTNQHLEYCIPIDYSYIDVSVFNTIEELEEIVAKDATKNKWLIFTDSIDSGKKLCNSIKKLLADKNDVGYIDAKYSEDEESTEIVEEITKENATRKKILISTAVIDNGVSIHDKELRNIVVLADTEETFIQMLGRKRPDGKKLKLYICRRDRNHFLKRLSHVNKVLEFYEKNAIGLQTMYSDISAMGFVYPFLKNYYSAMQISGQDIYINQDLEQDFQSDATENNADSKQEKSKLPPLVYPWYIQQQVLMDMFGNTMSKNFARNIIYPLNGLLAINSFSVQRFRNLHIYYKEIIQNIENDEDYFVKVQAKWLNIDASTINKIIIASDEDIHQIHRENICSSLEKWVDKVFDEEENRKLREEIKPELKYFAKHLVAPEEKKEKIKSAVEALTKNERNLSKNHFNLFMEYIGLDYEMIEGNIPYRFIRTSEEKIISE